MKPALLAGVVLVLSCTSDPLVMTFGGDVGLARNTGKLVDRDGPDQLLAGVRPMTTGGPFFANLETSLSDEPHPPGQRDPNLILVAPRSRAEALRGLTGVSLANNHSLDGGPGSWEATRSALEAVGVRPLNGPEVVPWGPWTIRVLAFTEVLPPEAPSQGTVAVLSPDRVADQLRAWRAEAPLQPVVVLVHWGEESSRYVTRAQRAEAERWIDAGADLVIGSHPHVWQPVETRGRGLIAWSLGNLAFDSGGTEVRSSGLLRVRWSAHRGVESWEVLPVTLQGPGRRPEPGGQNPVDR